MKKQEDSDKKDPKPSTSGSQGGAAASSGGDFGDAEQYQELNPIGTGRFTFELLNDLC